MTKYVLKLIEMLFRSLEEICNQVLLLHTAIFEFSKLRYCCQLWRHTLLKTFKHWNKFKEKQLSIIFFIITLVTSNFRLITLIC